jgi:thioredoxin reductase (NADPH)
VCRQTVAIIGGGNSAGQAAVFLSEHVQKVFMIIRGKNLSATMSSYLVERIEENKNIEIILNSEIIEVKGNEHIDSAIISDKINKSEHEIKINSVFSFIGATPNTEWLPDEIEKDEKGFIKTGSSLVNSKHWNLKRQPYLLETSRAGIFAAGDVRSMSLKRVSTAVGEGSMTVQFIHEYLKEINSEE